jgi:mercuric ion binding protein
MIVSNFNQINCSNYKMKTIRILLALFTALVATASAQTDTLIIKTSAVCGTCKKTIEHDLSFEKGIKSATLDLETKMLTVVYNPSKTTPDKIRQRIAKIGYDADDMKRDPKGFEKLPGCCKQESIH